MTTLRFADFSYFLDKHWESDMFACREPILIDPKWENTVLHTNLLSLELPLNLQEQNVFWIATSGSTGNPKLIRKTKVQILEEATFWKDNLLSIFGWPKPTRFLVSVPLCHLYGLIWGFVLPNLMGIESVPFRQNQIQTEELSETDLLVSIPFLLKKRKESGQFLPKYIISSGSKFPVPLAQELRAEGRVDIREIYGSTETGAMGYRNPMWKARFTLLPKVEAKLEEGALGDTLLINSPFVSETSLEKEVQTDGNSIWKRQTMIRDNGFFDTKDCGELSEIGWNYLGRVDRIAKIKGKRISLDLVESLIGSLSHIDDVAIVSYTEDEESMIACLVVSNLEIDGILDSFTTHLPKSHVPSKIKKTNQIPKLPNGKTDYTSISMIVG